MPLDDLLAKYPGGAARLRPHHGILKDEPLKSCFFLNLVMAGLVVACATVLLVALAVIDDEEPSLPQWAYPDGKVINDNLGGACGAGGTSGCKAVLLASNQRPADMIAVLDERYGERGWDTHSAGQGFSADRPDGACAIYLVRERTVEAARLEKIGRSIDDDEDWAGWERHIEIIVTRCVPG
jgi:hypothetical protein